jgi:prepilin-type N-terminal cleavage/methylation domain-containing protein
MCGRKRKNGFTLIELVVSMAIFMIILAITFGAISRYYLVKTFYEQQMNLQQNFLYAMDKLSDDFRQSTSVNNSAFINPPQNNAMIDATFKKSETLDPNRLLTFYGPDATDGTHVFISYYLKETESGTYAIYKKVGGDPPQPVTEEMHQLVRLYFIRYGGDLTAVIVGQLTYFGHTNKISFTSVIYSRNSPQQ